MDDFTTSRPIPSEFCFAGAPDACPSVAQSDPSESLNRETAGLKAELVERNSRWAALYHTAVLVAQRVYSDDILTQIVQHIMSLMQAQYGILLELDPIAGDLVTRVALVTEGTPPLSPGHRVKPGEGITGRALQTGELQVVDAYHRWPGRISAIRSERMCASAAAPLAGRRGVVGVLGVALGTEARRFSDDDLQMLTLFAQQAAAVLEANAGRRLEQELLVRNERQRLARDLHDGVQQRLATLLLKVDSCQAAVGDANPAVYTGLEWIATEIQGMIRELRLAVHALHDSDSDLDGRGLEEALRSLTKRWSVESGLRIQLEIASLPPGFLSPQCEQVLRRFVREALVNVQKHAHASSVTVKLERLRNNRVRMSVRDDGRGSAMAGRWGASQATGFGLLSLCEQVEALGGQFRFDSAPNHGTVVWAVVPAAEANGENTHIDR